MDKGRIIYLNGVTSSGKTSIVEALQARRDVFFYVVANDLFQEMVGEEYLKEDYWKYLGEVIIMMYHTAKLFSDLGKNVIIDSILVERDGIAPHYERMKEILPQRGISLDEMPRLTDSGGEIISAGRVRKLIKKAQEEAGEQILEQIQELVPETTYEMILKHI